jgi:hypothetical protein
VSPRANIASEIFVVLENLEFSPVRTLREIQLGIRRNTVIAGGGLILWILGFLRLHGRIA